MAEDTDSEAKRPRKVGVYDRPAPKRPWPLILLVVAVILAAILFATGVL